MRMQKDDEMKRDSKMNVEIVVCNGIDGVWCVGSFDAISSHNRHTRETRSCV